MTALKMATLAAALAGMLCAAGVRAQSATAAQHERMCYMIAADLYTGMRQDQRDVDAGRPWGSTFKRTLAAEKMVLAKVRATGDESFIAKIKVRVAISREAYELLQIDAPDWVPAAGEAAQREQATEFSVDMFNECMRLKH